MAFRTQLSNDQDRFLAVMSRKWGLSKADTLNLLVDLMVKSNQEIARLMIGPEFVRQSLDHLSAVEAQLDEDDA